MYLGIKHKKIYLFFVAVFVLFLIGRIVWAACGDTTHNVLGWGWNSYTGWISLSCANEEASADINFGVNVDIDTGAVTGYAWNGWGSNSGEGYWICFGTTCSGTPPAGSLSADYNSSTGQITGWAKFVGWGEDGWIKLSADDLSWGTQYFGDANEGTFGEDPANADSSWAWNSKIGWIQWKPTTCVCTEWTNDACGGNECSPSEMHQTRTCTPSGCDDESQCVNLTEICDNTIDDDCDGCVDSVDSDCGGIETNCEDGIDNNCDGFIDCDDSDCSEDPNCVNEPPNTPENLEVTSESCGQIDLTWGKVEGAESYSIYKEFTPGNCSACIGEEEGCGEGSGCYFVDNVPQCGEGEENCSYSDTAVIPRVEYYYCVSSVNADGESGPSCTNESTQTICYPGTRWREE